MSIERTNSFHLLLSDDELKLLKLLAQKIDLAKLFEAHSDAVKLAKADVEETKKKAK